MHILAPALNCVTNHIILPVHQAVVDITRYTPVSRLIEPCTSVIVDLLWTNRNGSYLGHVDVNLVKLVTAQLTARTYILISAVVLFNASVATSSLLATAAVVIGLYAGLHGIYLVDRALAAHFCFMPYAFDIYTGTLAEFPKTFDASLSEFNASLSEPEASLSEFNASLSEFNASLSEPEASLAALNEASLAALKPIFGQGFKALFCTNSASPLEEWTETLKGLTPPTDS